MSATASHAPLAAPPQPRRPARLPLPAPRAVLLAGASSPTNAALARAFRDFGYDCVHADDPAAVEAADIVLARFDVLPTLDGVDPGIWRLVRLERRGARVLNGSASLLSAHDKLATAIALGRRDIRQPRTVHVDGSALPLRLRPPYVVKPRFGSWGRDVFLCASETDLCTRLASLRDRRWFRRHGVLVQELVRSCGVDLRLVVAGGRVVGAAQRIAPPGEWRTNVAVGAVRRPVEPPLEARLLALRAVAALGLDLAGVDLVFDGRGRHVVIEVNGAVDFTPEYSLNGADVFASAVSALASGVPRLFSPEPL